MDAIMTASEVEAAAAKKGLNASQLCAAAGVSHSIFSRWRNNKTRPSLETYFKLVTTVENAPAPSNPAPRPGEAA